MMLKAAFQYFAAAFAAGIALGALRIVFIAPRIGPRAAELVEIPLMLAILVLVSRWIVGRTLPPGLDARLGMGFVALAFLLAAEFALVLPLRAMSGYVAGFDPVGAYYVALGIFALLPLFTPPVRIGMAT